MVRFSSSDLVKIAHIDTGLDLRGGQQQLLLLARGLRQRGHEQLIVCPAGSALEERAISEGFRVLSLPPRNSARVRGIFRLRERFWAESFAILHAHDGRGHTLAWLASLGMPVRRVASRRVIFLPSRLSTHLLKYDLSCHAIIAVSQFIRQLLVNSGVPEKKIEVIPDGVDVSPLPSFEARIQFRAQWGFADGEFLVGHVGAFTPEKGQDLAIDALALVAEQLPQARLLLAGHGPMRASPEITAKVAQAQGRVRLLGYLENISEFFAGLDLFIMPSRAEGLGSAALLAMTAGLAVVASRVGGLPEVVEEGETGWLVPPDSASALAKAIVAAASDRKRLGELGLKARERARQFSSDIMIERTEALYRRLLSETRLKTGGR